MSINEILAGIDAEIARLQQVRTLLNGEGAHKTVAKKRHKLSPEARARIATAQKARWAKVKKAGK